MLCDQVEEYKIDFLIIGRRGMNQIKRALVGSNSQYVVENAKCNVVVVKGDWAAEEQHDNRVTAAHLEETERERRVQDAAKEAKEAEHLRKFESDLDRNIAILAEEEERIA